ncbi:pyrroline-5-carboxylate reductase [Zavarzinia compransoris]|uniref:Pyrroline-5-carboxylate reductase n=1 Tax=Zavarzinia compransoris TaxID=1264899 RepID=A0A317E0P2_9PROT|nr:pyrroline-5-carboxylate reductase [Zavarzinia compransoris]PWR20014.1 pyrroline-5-carboxylate reductase [Zavarzinia compransoris]TDP44866.1 pyrroline-5-carboxylate reductase [Zavarzinia compransoris]
MTGETTLALDRPLLLVGCGKMGGAMLDGWLARGLVPARTYVVEPAGAPALSARGVHVVAGLAELPADLDPAAVIVAVKPQTMDKVLPALAPLAGARTLVLSIAAGKRIALFEAALGAGVPVVRAMPNTPAAVGRGMTVLVAGAAAGPAERDLAGRLCAAVGATGWVDDEGLIDVVTALSGGGPAYVFLLIETLAKAGAAAGLDPALAMRLARETVIGSGELARLSPEPADQLRRNVTSPAGTTERALNVLMAADGLQPLFDRAIAAAAARSRELAG